MVPNPAHSRFGICGAATGEVLAGTVGRVGYRPSRDLGGTVPGSGGQVTSRMSRLVLLRTDCRAVTNRSPALFEVKQRGELVTHEWPLWSPSPDKSVIICFFSPCRPWQFMKQLSERKFTGQLKVLTFKQCSRGEV